MPYLVEPLNLNHSTLKEEVETLLSKNGLRLDQHIDYTCGIYNADYELIATGSSYGKTLRCLGVHPDYRGQGLLNQLITHLQQKLFMEGLTHLFVYTESNNKQMFSDLGFHLIADDQAGHIFLENQRNGFQQYIDKLQDQLPNTNQNDEIASIVMNANPMTKGHLALIEKAASKHDWVYVFVLSDDQSFFTNHVRREIVEKSTETLSNVVILPTDDYMISQASFPSYFQEDEDEVIKSQAGIDVHLFIQIAKALGITHRYVGSEPTSRVTNQYNQVLETVLCDSPIELQIVERIKINGEVISASTLRQSIVEDNWATIEAMATPATLDYLKSEAGQATIQKLRQSDNVIHY